MGLEAVWALPPALQVAPPYPRGNSDGACPGLMTDWSVMPTAARSASGAHVVVVLWVQDANGVDAAGSRIGGQVVDIQWKGVGPELNQLPVADA